MSKEELISSLPTPLMDDFWYSAAVWGIAAFVFIIALLIGYFSHHEASFVLCFILGVFIAIIIALIGLNYSNYKYDKEITAWESDYYTYVDATPLEKTEVINYTKQANGYDVTLPNGEKLMVERVVYDVEKGSEYIEARHTSFREEKMSDYNKYHDVVLHVSPESKTNSPESDNQKENKE